ncbi:MAG: inositol monophosphatase [Coxiella sp. RIFCSPHIGHO2_12_FULL_42_15]|nr:MAG: inositol monophosphatase [Coxiella sp. RIFCSPHIGHO2_12_FULL_42_15]
MHPMLNIAIQAARSAGKIIVRFLDHLETSDVNEKSRHDFVTKADQMAEKEIIEQIRRRYPSHSIIAEESEPVHGDRFCWIIDPLDGTTNFIHGLPQFAVSIALRIDEKLTVGVVYDPIKDELFTAERGKGAQLNNRRIRVSNCLKMENALLGTGFPCRNTEKLPYYLKTFATLFPNSAGVRRMGAASLDLAYLAAGRLDAFWEMDLSIWDIAAGALLVVEAGGMVSDFQGEEKYLENGHIVAASPKLHKPLLDALVETKRE